MRGQLLEKSKIKIDEETQKKLATFFDNLPDEVKENFNKMSYKQIESVDIRSSMIDVWNELQEPLPIESYGFLYLQPKALSLGKMAFSKDKVDVDLNLTIAPMVVTENIKYQRTALPDMQPFKKTNGLDMMLDLNASYDSLSTLISTSLKDKEILFKKKKIIIKSIVIRGALDSTIIFAVAFEGAKKGTVFLVGKPTIDEKNQSVSIRDIAFDIETKSVLLKTAKWMFNDKIISEIQKVASTFLKNITLLHTKIVAVGKAISSTAKAYEELVPTAEKTVLAPARRIHNLGVAGDRDKLAIEYPEAPGDVRDLKNDELETGDDYIDAEEVDEK